ncbi:MAG: FAD-binding oxidoreductase [Steroidobacteraceae bacterium]
MIALTNRFESLPDAAPALPWGNGRSYGDVCQNADGLLLATRGLDRFIAFDPINGLLSCEAGVLLAEITALTLPQGWMLPVTPGTSFVTVGGAIANDVHGKNHHVAGTFGHHIVEFELLRSDGARLRCSPTQNADWFRATVGGLGLTGVVPCATLQMRRVPGPWIRGDSIRFNSVDEFMQLSHQADAAHEYVVAWIDCVASGRNLGRGIFQRGNHQWASAVEPRPTRRHFPLTPPLSLVNALSLRTFNQVYYHRPAASQRDALWHYHSFFYPLDGILEWNRMYGPRGFFQYQCVVPPADAAGAINSMLRRIQDAGLGSFLAVLKNFGDRPAAGMLSFPRPGTTLALDFPNHGVRTLKLLEELDVITRAAGGAVYPAKDARMSAASFQQYYPQWQAFERFVDPKFSSSFWRRVTEQA